MRPTREQTVENRQRILDTAARLFRENGIHAVGVDAVMKGAGLTHGGFYGHFKSKSDLTAEAVSYAMEDSLKSLHDPKSMEDLAAIYLSREHRDAAGSGCTVAALGPELARLPEGQRGTIGNYVRARIAQVEAFQAANGGTVDRGRAIADLSSLVGALIMARTVDDPELSDEILSETARYLARKEANTDGS